MSLVNWADTCGLCDGTRFWPSKSGYKVCFTCHPDPLQALIILARRASPGAIRRAEHWAQVEADGGELSRAHDFNVS